METGEPQEQALQQQQSGPELEQLKIGPHRPVFREHSGDVSAALKKLREVKIGEAVGALQHPRVPATSLVYGEEGTPEKNFEDGWGVAKIDRKHADALDQLADRYANMHIVKDGENRMELSDGEYTVKIRKDFDGKPSRNWLLTAFKKNQPSAEGRTGVPGTRATGTPPVGGFAAAPQANSDAGLRSAQHPVGQTSQPSAALFIVPQMLNTHNTPPQPGELRMLDRHAIQADPCHVSSSSTGAEDRMS